MGERISSFSPVIDEKSKVLILGSIPGSRSLQMQEYYAHPQNVFWKIMFTILKEEYPSNYSQKLMILKKHNIALWDVIDSCERKGSLDSEIKNETNNDVLKLLKKHPNLEVIFCNGQKAYKNVLKIIGYQTHIPIEVLPSTSPLHTVSFAQKLEKWQIINQYLTKVPSGD